MNRQEENQEAVQDTFQAENATTDAGMDTFFAENPDYPHPDTHRKAGHGMSRNTRLLLAAVGVLVILGAALTILLVTRHQQAQEAAPDTEALSSALLDEEETGILLNPESGEDVTEIRILNQGADSPASFRVYLQEAATETEKAVYTIETLEDVRLDKGLISTLVNNASSLSASTLVEEQADNLERYGLAAPLAEVEMEYADGDVFAFSVGNVSPLDDTKTYIAVNGDVYLVKSSLMANYQKSAVAFVSTVMIETPADTETTPVIASLTIEREDLDYPISISYAYELDRDDDDASVGGNASTHKMLSPVNVYLSANKASGILNDMFGLSAVEVVQVHPSEADLKAAGIDAPFCTVSATCEDGTAYTFHFGKQYTTANDTAAYYAYIEGMPVVYGVSRSRATWTSVMPDDIHSANIFNTYVWNIATLDVTGDTQELHFSGTGTDKDDYVVTENNQPCDTERFRLFYRFLLNIYGDELFFETALPDAAPDIEIHLTTQDGMEDYTVAFYQLSDLNALIAVNGIPTYKTRTSCIETIRHNMDIFDSPDETFTLTWQ